MYEYFHSSAKRLQQLVDDVLENSKLEQGILRLDRSAVDLTVTVGRRPKPQPLKP